MKLTVKEIMEKCETDDKVNFKGIVEKVWQFNKKESKFAIGYQNVIVKDETGSIKVICNIKNKEEIYQSSIEGNEVEVDGKISIYNGQVNIFAKLIFQGGEVKSKELAVREPGMERTSPTAELSVTKEARITREEIRIKCLELTAMLYKAETETTTKEWIAVAKIFEGYVCQEKPKEEKKKTSEVKPKEKIKDTGENLSQEHIKQINVLMALVENRGAEGKVLINEMVKNKGYTTVKEFNENEIKEATKGLEQMGTSEIPF